MKKLYKNCNYCKAYSGVGCMLKYKTDILKKYEEVEDYTTKQNLFDIFFVKHKPIEICERPKTKKEFIKLFKERIK